MKIIIESIPHADQKYQTAGDYWRSQDGTLHIVVSETGCELYNRLVGLHELVEVMAMEQRGVPLIDSNNFDIPFEEARLKGEYSADDEPGDHPACPYHWEHRLASVVEELVALDLGVDWDDYGKSVAYAVRIFKHAGKG